MLSSHHLPLLAPQHFSTVFSLDLTTLHAARHLLRAARSCCWQDPNFSEVAGTVRRARPSPRRAAQSVQAAAPRAASSAADGVEKPDRTDVRDAQSEPPDQRACADDAGSPRIATSDTEGPVAGSFGTLLALRESPRARVEHTRTQGGRGSKHTLSPQHYNSLPWARRRTDGWVVELPLHRTTDDRPLLSELWPDLQFVPMDVTTAAASGSERKRSNADCARRLEIFLDLLSLEATTCTRHLLDDNFSGAFSAEELALKRQLGRFRARLQANPLARQSRGFVVIAETLRRLGDQSEVTED